jgi:tetratricopeptide (TPR) repeat protein
MIPLGRLFVTRRFRAFISYSWADKDWAEWLHRSLELYRTPKSLVGRDTPLGPAPAGLHPVFRDRDEEAAGHGLRAAIETALEASDFLIVLCSPRSAKSEWVNREVAWFKIHKDKTRILALVVDGEPGASARGDETAECFPKTLTHKVGADLQPTEEPEDPPLAADARKEGDGKRGAKLKLAAALLGVGLDDLVKRDERRRALRRRWMMSGMAAGMAALGGLSLFAFNQRDAAVIARNDAVKARDDAEGLIELILTDLKSDLEGYGTLKSVTQIGNRAIGYYEGQEVKALTPDQLGRRARVLLMLGEADNKRGDLDAALARYKTAEATTSEQLARDPENAQRIFDHAQSVFWVGYIAWQRGDHANAKEQFTEYHRLATRLVEIHPENDDWRMEENYAFSNLGTLAMDEGDAAEAEAWFRKSLEVSTSLLEERPEDIGRVLAAGQSYAWLANSLNRQARVPQARQALMDQIAAYERALARHPGNAAVANSAVSAHFGLAQTLIAANSPNEALTSAISGTRLAEQAMALDPSDAEGAERASFSHTILGQAQFFAGDRAGARKTILRAIEIGERLVKTDESVLQWRGKILAQPRLDLARLDALDGDGASAIKIFGETAEALRTIIDAGKADPVIIRRYCAALAGRARLAAEFESGWAEIVEAIAAHEKKHGPEALVLLAEAYQRTGRPSEAGDIAHRLFSAGYRHPDLMALLDEFPELKAAAEGGQH